MTTLNRTLASVAQQVENRDERKWLFDFDVDNCLSKIHFINDIVEFSKFEEDDIESFDTPNGFHIIVPHGFDTRELMEIRKDYDISVHKDRLMFLDMIQKEQ